MIKNIKWIVREGKANSKQEKEKLKTKWQIRQREK